MMGGVMGIGLMLALFAGIGIQVLGVERFPPPDFDAGYKMPAPTTPGPRALLLEYLDVTVLVAALSLASYFVLKKRSRSWIAGLMLFSLGYFGFWRKGCVCAIGSTQDVVLALFDPTYAVPLTVVFFFILPLVFTLFFGRTFCAAVCPLGAIQDAVLIRPVKVQPWLEHALGLLPFFYLGAAVLFAATGSAFIICQYDPFVAFFRRSGSINMLALGAAFLLVGIFVGRPYCRFLCPYSALLRCVSHFSKWNVTLTPDDCIGCQLCDVACPYGAIREPAANTLMANEKAGDKTGKTAPAAGAGTSKTSRSQGKGAMAVALVLLPVLIGLGGWLGSRLSVPLSRMQAGVNLAEHVAGEEAGKAIGPTEINSTLSAVRLSAREQREENARLAIQAFRQSGRPTDELYATARQRRQQFAYGGWWLGAFIGLVIGAKMILLGLPAVGTSYEPNRASCVACGRCYTYCPKEQVRLKRVQRQKSEPANIAVQEES